MTEEELEKEAEKYVTENTGFSSKQPLGKIAVRIFLAGAEPREKRIAELEKENAELKKDLEICETNADIYYNELTKLQEQLVKTTQIGMTCSNCKWSQYDEDEMCYCCSDKDKWELKLRR